MMIEIIIAVITGICSFGGSFLAFNKNTALISYRLEQLEKRFDENDINERLLKLEIWKNEQEHKNG